LIATSEDIKLALDRRVGALAAKESSWTVAGLVFAPIVLLRYGAELFEWRKNRKRARALISELDKLT